MSSRPGRLRRKARRVKFNKVNVLEFNRVLGRCAVPDEGTFQLGLGDVLLEEREFSVKEFEAESPVKGCLTPLRERDRMALLGIKRDDPSVREETHELSSIRTSRKRCVCAKGCLCKDKNCACFREGIECYNDGTINSCGCALVPVGCRNPAGVYRFDEEQVYYARRDKLEEVQGAKEAEDARLNSLYGNLGPSF
eukprot:TRINITY_DN50261_c0_g1_i1.p1 TRINITY_DN50261_c0_g1~~TRINITY_DN50261_c0_g1_i1.p1  ORF type:complete len:195 (-),score=28.40 TRINITY_DN50261_c0_g1_i1:31-615(-)